MSEIQYGGPAFPSEQGHNPDGLWNQTYDPGMTLRDWFAGQALESRACPHNGYEFDAIAVWCGRMADAMLKERNK
jgi:hypothetical protein